MRRRGRSLRPVPAFRWYRDGAPISPVFRSALAAHEWRWAYWRRLPLVLYRREGSQWREVIAPDVREAN